MKRINAVLSMAAVILMTATVASAQQESAASATTGRYGWRYTVNYATGGHQGEGPETVVSITNRGNNPNNVYVLFKDSEGTPICSANGNMQSNYTEEFGTAADASPFSIEYPAFAIVDETTNPPTTSEEPCPPFEGRAEIYSKNQNLQIAAWMNNNGMPTRIPVEKKSQATSGD